MVLTHRLKRYIAALTLTLVLTLGVAIAAGLKVGRAQGSYPPQASIVLILLFAALAVLVAVPWWRALGEMQREAQLTSWYWGGSFGGAVGVLSALVIGGAHSPLVLGTLLMGAAQVASFAVFWVASRFLRRRAAS